MNRNYILLACLMSIFWIDIGKTQSSTILQPELIDALHASAHPIPSERLPLYKSITFVPIAAFTDQLWYLLLASEATTTSNLFLGINFISSWVLIYGYEYSQVEWANGCIVCPRKPNNKDKLFDN